MKIRGIFTAVKCAAFAAVAAVSLPSCDGVENVFSGETGLALKEALGIGVQTAVQKLSADGYIAEAATKIGLPKEAQTAFTAIAALQKTNVGSTVMQTIGFEDNLEETLVQLFNDAAKDAAPEAASVFADAVTGMTIKDAEAILFGGAGAATTYLKDNTYTKLQAAFHPTITNSMNRVSVAGYTATEGWSKFAQLNNKLAEYVSKSSSVISLLKATRAISSTQYDAIMSVAEVDSDISDYLTGKALDGLFYKVSQKEDDIRTNASARTSDLLQRVFGRLDGTSEE